MDGDSHDWWLEPDHVDRATLILDSHRLKVGRELFPRGVDAIWDARMLRDAIFVVVAHGTEADPVLCYGNRAALRLWEMNLDEFLSTPSRLTAEPVARAEREAMLRRTARDGYIDDYEGVRISRSGRRFRIGRALVWNLEDGAGDPAGQAAAFDSWEYL